VDDLKISNPMVYKTHKLLGKIIKVHGFDGTVIVKLEQDFKEGISKPESVFLEIDGKPVPFLVSGFQDTGGNIIRLRFDGYDSAEKMGEFTGCKVFLTSGKTGKDTDSDLTDLRDYKLYLADDSLLGTVIEVINSPGQWLLSIRSKEGKEILIPFHEDLIIGIDERKKIIRMDLPEGLTEVNQ
jgi:16S rRNA processing protein RimM